MQCGAFLLAALLQSNYDYVAQVLEFGQNMRQLLPETCMNEQDARPAVVEYIDVIVGAQQSIERNRYRPYLDRPEKSSGHVRRIQHKQSHALFHVKPQLKQSIPNAIGKLSHLRVTIRLPFIINSRLAAAPLRQIAI